MAEIEEIESFYDEYVDRQVMAGINDRHKSILNWMKRFGFRETDDVLEIGCGVGTLTELICKSLGPEGTITAVDLSPKSIENAKQRLNQYTNAAFIATNAVEHAFDKQYDVIIMPDVIEHIPIEVHAMLFENMRRAIKPDGTLVIHIPDPNCLEWTHKHQPEKLQVIDQPIHTDILVQNTYPFGWYIHFLSSYSIWKDPVDYQIIALKPKRDDIHYTVREPSTRQKAEHLAKRIKQKIQITLGKPVTS